MNNLKEIRRRQGLSAQGLSVKAMASTRTITGIECWGNVPTSLTCQRLAQALGVQVEDIWPKEAEADLQTETKGDTMCMSDRILLQCHYRPTSQCRIKALLRVVNGTLTAPAFVYEPSQYTTTDRREK